MWLFVVMCKKIILICMFYFVIYKIINKKDLYEVNIIICFVLLVIFYYFDVIIEYLYEDY